MQLHSTIEVPYLALTTMTGEEIKSAILLANHISIDLMRIQEYEGAESLLRGGLSLVDDCVQDIRRAGESDEDVENPPGKFHPVNLGANIPPPAMEELNHFTIFDRAVTIELDQNEPDFFATKPSESLCIMMYCALYYNLGLCLHLSSFDQASNNRDVLRQAYGAYQRSHEIIYPWPEDDSYMIMEIATWNNKGFIHFQRGELEEVRNCRGNMTEGISAMLGLARTYGVGQLRHISHLSRSITSRVEHAPDRLR